MMMFATCDDEFLLVVTARVSFVYQPFMTVVFWLLFIVRNHGLNLSIATT